MSHTSLPCTDQNQVHATHHIRLLGKLGGGLFLWARAHGKF